MSSFSFHTNPLDPINFAFVRKAVLVFIFAVVIKILGPKQLRKQGIYFSSLFQIPDNCFGKVKAGTSNITSSG